MKTKIWIAFFTLSVCLSCSKNYERAGITLDWQVGDDMLEVTKLINSEASELMHLEVTRESLCPNTGVKITILQNNEVIFEKEINPDLNFMKDIPIKANSDINIASKIVYIEDNNSACVWLGLANCTITY